MIDGFAARPWGQLAWLLPKLRVKAWSLIGCLSTEQRSLASLQAVGGSHFSHSHYFQIEDPEPDKECAERLAQVKCSLEKLGSRNLKCASFPLLESLDTISAATDSFTSLAEGSVVFDITTFPKRWFFPMLKLMIRDDRIENLIVTYSSAERYGSELSSNFEPVRTLPGFASVDGRTAHDVALIGIGFEPSGLIDFFKEQQVRSVKLLFPFPPGPPGFVRNWAFVRQIEQLIKDNQVDGHDIFHVDMYDVPRVFDALCSFTRDGSQSSASAPYGPKTVSLAMCLYSISVELAKRDLSPVYYAQPRRYAADYSTGIRLVDDKPDVESYCIKYGGKYLYEIE